MLTTLFYFISLQGNLIIGCVLVMFFVCISVLRILQDYSGKQKEKELLKLLGLIVFISMLVYPFFPSEEMLKYEIELIVRDQVYNEIMTPERAEEILKRIE